MGKGDNKTRRGKLFSGSYGVLRPRKRSGSFSVVSTTKKTVAKSEPPKAAIPKDPPQPKAEEVKPVAEEAPVAEETKPAAEKATVAEEAKPAAKKPAAKKPAAKATTAKKPAAKKPAAKKAKDDTPEEKE
jgi:ribosomal small subunit protein bTHX